MNVPLTVLITLSLFLSLQIVEAFYPALVRMLLDYKINSREPHEEQSFTHSAFLPFSATAISCASTSNYFSS